MLRIESKEVEEAEQQQQRQLLSLLLLRCYCDVYSVLWDGKRVKCGAS